MTDFTVVEAKPFHCGQMARLLRIEHQQAVARIGLNSHRELRASFDLSSYRRAWLIDGKLASIGGVTGNRLSPDGYIWLAFSSLATKYPLEMARLCRKQLAEIAVTKRKLVTSILEGDEASKRFAIFMGFVPLDYEGITGAETKFGRREILRRFEHNTEARQKIGNGFAVAMTYYPEAA